MNQTKATSTAKERPPFVIRELRPGDLSYIVDHLRPADARELEAVWGDQDFLLRLNTSVAFSEETLVCEVAGVPVATFGIVAISDESAGIWCIGTSGVVKMRRHFLTASRSVLDGWFGARPGLKRLCNFTHASNNLHHKWLRTMGAELSPSVPMGALSEHFHLFTINRELYRV